MKTKAFIIGILALTAPALSTMAQKQFTLEDLNYGGTNYHNMAPKNQWYAWWGDELVHTEVEQCALVNKQTGKETTLFTLDDIRKAAKAEAHHLQNASFPYPDKTLVLLNLGNKRMLVDWKKKAIAWSIDTENYQAEEWNAHTQALAYVKNHQLYVNNNGKHTQLTTDGSREMVYGQSVHRDEFGITKGLFWSPDGTKLAFYKMDQSMVKDYPQVNVFARQAEYKPDKYPMAGETSHKVWVGIFDLKSQKTIYLQAGDPTDRYFTNIAWAPNSRTLYLFELNRDQNDCRLQSYNTETGALIKTLYRETDEKYVEPLHPITFLPWDEDKFILQSQKDGFNHLYLYNKEGQALKQLTKGPWVVEGLAGFNVAKKQLIIVSNELSPIQRNTFSVDIKTGKRTLIGSPKGWHNIAVSGQGKYILDKYSTPTEPRNIDLVETQKGKLKRLFTAPDPWKGYNVPEYSCGTIKAADGKTDLYYRLVKPIGFAPDKKYPTVVYVYGGPHAHNVDASWHYGSRSWETYMAQKGYVLFILDNRGSENRGKDFEQVTFRHLGKVETEDQMQGVKFLQSLPYVDTNRIGVHGWSFGGFMTITMMTRHPEVFKVGVAGGPVIDWALYEVMYGERYMDTPKTNTAGYLDASLLKQAANLRGKLQIIIGANDKTCVPQHSLLFLSECIKAGTQPDFFVYPGEPHNMRGHQSVHLHERITQYFEDYLKPIKQ